ncbi:hypothetical protein HRF87_09235 [Bacillus sp. CRN 9]|nr:hypothetical protein [Bacillus sp. CRN 9]
MSLSHLGRPKAVITLQFEESYNQWVNKEISVVEAMKKASMSKTTFYRKVKELKEK